MSTKRDHNTSLILNLENAILALEERVGTDEIWAYVNMILKGFIRNGVITEEYIALAQQAMALQASEEFQRQVLKGS